MGKGRKAKKSGATKGSSAAAKGVPRGVTVSATPNKNASGSLSTIPENSSAAASAAAAAAGADDGRGAAAPGSARLQGEELLKDPMAALFGTVKVQEPEEVIVHKVKKNKKPKLSKEEKEFMKLENATNSFMNSGESYNTFIERIDTWILKNFRRVVKLFTEYDIDGDGELSYEEFKLGMADLGAPCNQIELHALCKLIDADGDGTIDISEFQNGIQYKSRQTSVDEGGEEGTAIKLTITKEHLTSCPQCGMGMWKPKVEMNPSFIRLHINLLTFHTLRKKQRLNLHGSFVHILHAHTLVKGVEMLIAEKTGISSRNFDIYRTPHKSNESRLEMDKTLAEYGWRGGPRLKPQDVSLYYDFDIQRIDCPLLLSQNEELKLVHL